MRSAASSPIKRYHEVPITDIDNGEEDGADIRNINSGVAIHTDLEDDVDDRHKGGNGGSFHNSTSPSFGRMVGRAQYSRILLTSDETNNNSSLQHETNDLNDDETNSLVLGDASSPTSIRMNEKINRKGIFRESPASTNDGGHSTSISRSPSGAASSSSMNPVSMHNEEGVSSGPTGLLSRQGSRCASSTVSSVDWDDDEFDDDVVNIRRYHLEFGHGSLQQNQQWQQRMNDTDDPSQMGMNIIFDCFRCRIRKSLSTFSYHWQSLRQAARQRRAARLLTMPSENVRHKVRACFISWFCDATDIGIAFTASCVLLWIIFGVLTHNTAMKYWMIGTTLFIIRISARRFYDVCRSFVSSNISNRRQQRQEQRGRLGSRQHLSSVDYDQNHNSDLTIDPNSHNLPTHT
jgi:hypothetical protein